MKDVVIQNEKKIRYIVIFAFGLLVTILFLVLSFYNHPSADDFNYSMNVRQYGFFGAQQYWYTHWSGRYFATFLLSLNPLVINSVSGYKMMSFLLIFLTVFSLYFFIDTVFNKARFLEKTYIVILAFFTFVMLMPSVAEGFYWMSGAYTYQIGNILTLLLGALIISYNRNKSKIVFVLAVITLIALIGTNETSMFISVLIILFINVFRIIKDKTIPVFLFVLLGVAAICSMVVYFAPGNDFRSLNQSNSHQFLFSFKSSVSEAMDMISNWWWIGFLLIFSSYKLASDMNWEKKETNFERIYLNPFFALLLLFLIIVAGFFTCFWSLGLYPPLRTINTIYFYFIIISVYIGVCTAVKLKRSGIKIPEVPFAMWLIPLFIAFYVYKYQNNVSTAYFDLKDGTAAMYNDELLARYSYLRKNDGKICEIEKLKNIPATLFFSDISMIEDKVMNEAYSKYFGKESIIVKEVK